MNDVLSQAEIDSLLSALQSGTVSYDDYNYKEEHKQADYKEYDFRRPNKYSKEQLRTLQVLHDNYSRLLSSFLSGYLRSNVIIQVNSVEQFTFEDFMRSVPSPTLVTVFNLNPLKGNAIMVTDPYFIFPVIDLIFGGTGAMPRSVREVTDIELSVARKFNARLLEYLATAWNDIFEIEPVVQTVESNPRMHQYISLGEIVAVLTFNTVVGNSDKGLVNLCFPFMALEPVLSQISAHYHFEGKGYSADAKGRQIMEYWLGLAEVELTAVLGSTGITVGDFLQLQEGDVLTLERSINQDLELLVGNKLKYKIQAGTLGEQIAAQITSFVDEGDSSVK